MGAQLVQRTELDGFRWAGLGTGRRHAAPLPVKAERTLVGMAIVLAPTQDAEGTGTDAVAAAVTDVRLQVNVAELVVNERAGRTGLLAGGFLAVLAHIAQHQPAATLLADLLLEGHVPPGAGRQVPRVVVAVAGEVEAVGRE